MLQAVRSRRVLLGEAPEPATIWIADGKIARLAPYDDAPDEGILEGGEALLMPGVVDSHVHLNEPGRTAWEGFETGTRAAAAGGITTLVDMPLNCIPVTTSLTALETKREAARRKIAVDLACWGGVVPGNAAELEPMINAGVRGFKAFLCPSGIEDYPAADEATLRAAMRVLGKHGVPLLVHAELEDAELPAGGDPRRYATYLESRPRRWENRAVRLMIALCRETGCPVHIVHLSSADALADLQAARAEGLPVGAETCPHYLVLASEDIPDGATAYKCAPPIRERENRARLWEGLTSGVLSLVACDHSPCTPELKRPDTGDFMQAWGGIASLQFSLPLLWTAARERGIGPSALSRWLCQGPARLASLDSKGALAPGLDADFVLWAPEATFVVEPGSILHRHPITPYLGRTLHGVIEHTVLRGEVVYDRGSFATCPTGRLL